jgi:hypothetical protein
MMKLQLEALYAEKVHWRKVEARAVRMQRERDEEIERRKAVEAELDDAFAQVTACST